MEEVKEKEADEYLDDLITAFSRSDSFWLRQLSNKLIEEAIVKDNPNLAKLSLIAYSLSKLTSKPHFTYSKNWEKFRRNLLILFATEKQEENTPKKMGELLENVISEIRSFDSEATNYIRDAIEKAKIKQASRAYAFGLSLSQAAELTGADKSSLMDYVGSTTIHDQPFTLSKPLKQRYKNAKEMLD